MVHRSMENLKLDKRLVSRRGWVDPGELDQAREALPDVQDKAEKVEVYSETPRPSGGEGEETASSESEVP